jgi:hypothetical protein
VSKQAIGEVQLKKAMLLKKQHISELPHQDICSMTETELETWATKNLVNRAGTWLLPQMVAHFGSWRLAKTNGSIDVVQTLKQNCEHNSQNTALWRLTRIPRTCLIARQIAQPEYATLTPLILAGFKRMQNIPYEAWRGLPKLEYVVEPRLLEAVAIPKESFPSLGSERLLAIRQQGLTTRSGKTAGQLKSPETTWSLTGITDTELGHLPKLTQSLLTQIWLAHPQHRHELMILDPLNWDHKPEPLIANNVFTPEPKEIAPLKEPLKLSTKTLLPWM